MTKEQRAIRARAKWRISTLDRNPHIIKIGGVSYELGLEEAGLRETFCAKVFGNSPKQVLARAEQVLKGVNRPAVSEADRKWLRSINRMVDEYDNPGAVMPYVRELLSILKGQLGDNFDT